jgi:hypothetical protein
MALDEPVPIEAKHLQEVGSELCAAQRPTFTAA